MPGVCCVCLGLLGLTSRRAMHPASEVVQYPEVCPQAIHASTMYTGTLQSAGVTQLQDNSTQAGCISRHTANQATLLLLNQSIRRTCICQVNTAMRQPTSTAALHPSHGPTGRGISGQCPKKKQKQTGTCSSTHSEQSQMHKVRTVLQATAFS